MLARSLSHADVNAHASKTIVGFCSRTVSGKRICNAEQHEGAGAQAGRRFAGLFYDRKSVGASGKTEGGKEMRLVDDAHHSVGEADNS